jgi:RNA polymerase primary sigma factor
MAKDKPPLSPELESLLELLDARHREALILRFGFDRDEPPTLEELGVVLGVSREEARAIEAEAMEALAKKADE